MANDLSTLPNTSLAIPLDDSAVDGIVSRAQSFSMRVRGVLRMQNAPNEAERVLLMARRNLLANSMGHDREAIGAIIARMLKGFPASTQANEQAWKVVQFYVEELGMDPAVPTWAVERACTDIRKGQAADIGPRTYPRPSTAAVRRLCDQYAWKARAEIRTLTDVLRGRQADPELTQEERDRVGNFWDTLAHNLKQRNGAAGVAAREVSELEAMIGPEAFATIPDAPRRRHAGSIGHLASKVTGVRG